MRKALLCAAERGGPRNCGVRARSIATGRIGIYGWSNWRGDSRSGYRASDAVSLTCYGAGATEGEPLGLVGTGVRASSDTRHEMAFAPLDVST